MRLNYHTGIATLVQFVVMTLLILISGIESVATGCTRDGGDCIESIFVSVVFFILSALFFGAIWVLGFAAQDKRSPRLAYILIAVETSVLFIAAHNARNHTNTLSLVTSVVDILLAIWVIMLAYKLSRSKGGRIMAGGRKRRTINTPRL